MTTIYRPKLMHAGVHVQDMEAMKAFYMNVCAFVVSDEAVHERTGRYFCFLTGDLEKHHEFVLVKGTENTGRSAVFQFSFLLSSLDELREAQARAVSAGGSGLRPLNHGNAWSVYVDDP